MKGYPRWFPPLLHTVLVAVAVSGVLLVPSMLSFRFEWDVPWLLEGDQRLPVAALHTLLSFVMLGVLGALLAVHVRVGWTHGGNRVSGFLLLGALAGLLLSCLGIFYFGDEDAARLACGVHAGLAALLLAAFAFHYVRGRALARARQRRGALSAPPTSRHSSRGSPATAVASSYR